MVPQFWTWPCTATPSVAERRNLVAATEFYYSMNNAHDLFVSFRHIPGILSISFWRVLSLVAPSLDWHPPLIESKKCRLISHPRHLFHRIATSRKRFWRTASSGPETINNLRPPPPRSCWRHLLTVIGNDDESLGEGEKQIRTDGMWVYRCYSFIDRSYSDRKIFRLFRGFEWIRAV